MNVNVQLPPPATGDADKASAAALRLLALEAEVRQQASEQALWFHLVNSVRDLVPYGQAMAWRRSRRGGAFQLRAISGLPVADRHTPLARALQAWLAEQDRAARLGALWPVELPVLAHDPKQTALDDFPLRHALWLPLSDRPGAVSAGVLFLRNAPFEPREQALLKRLGDTYGHAWRVFAPHRRWYERLPLTRKTLAVAVALLVGAAFVPVRLSVMAPVEVIADQPYILTAPINGVIKRVLVAPNTPVQASQPLVQFEDIQPRNEMVLAQQQLAVAEARDNRTSAAAFKDPEAAHEMAIAAAEHDLARVSYDYAVEVLQRTLVRSPIEGLAVYSDRRDWEGRSVMVGEEILQVADPARVTYRIDLSTGNAIELAQGNPVSIYLESAPLGGLKAHLQSVSYTPHTTSAGLTSYTVIALPEDGAPPRIGARGTARVYGDYAPLAFQLLRRPIAVVRQYVGI
ncbi:HlyD family efflux transporter periplasmic adaptor subunit [Pseudomonas mangiferae]|uniref:HlyD family efflux transporter periplasmic adaptor subunit n=1 Tax=Pseudomonas mangiferae TaxID=2593654 RepID=A0A553H461_9PSED|nr:HlyD family efflux transporter periplasmic adaptor subunit [Pseudomonas mangiferae]TRX76527.1 HlyD family efflux transporter periplasmic adaptor subunit [Pseudomonas mangiferae]